MIFLNNQSRYKLNLLPAAKERAADADGQEEDLGASSRGVDGDFLSSFLSGPWTCSIVAGGWPAPALHHGRVCRSLMRFSQLFLSYHYCASLAIAFVFLCCQHSSSSLESRTSSVVLSAQILHTLSDAGSNSGDSISRSGLSIGPNSRV